MAQDEQPPGGLLSKVVKFVRNPTVNWADLDQPEDKDSHYSKQMLKEMIERKRANDFVRRREFDQLRKLRLRGPLAGTPGGDAADRPSFFNTSQPSKIDDRAGTLKKIDEIEAQMSKQWWKARGERPPEAAAAPVVPPTPMAPVASRPEAEEDEAAHYFATTIDASLPLASDDAFPPSSRADAVLLEDLPAFNRTQPPPIEVALEGDWPSTPAFVETAPHLAHDPVLEEAAIRFANGDDAGTEAALLALLEPTVQPGAAEETWMTLFDLYRAVGPRDRFDALAARFMVQFARPAPVWFSIADIAASAAQPPVDEADVVRWTSPALLGAPHVLALQSTLVQRKPTMLVLDWSPLAAIDPLARDPLTSLVMALALQPITIRCTAGAQLEGLLRRQAVSGDRSVHQGWWRLRLDWLRVSLQPQAFDLVALDYCVTFEVSPPAWSEVACRFAEVDADAAASMSVALPPSGPQSVTVTSLAGVLTEDATEALAPFELQAGSDGLVVVSCEQLVRIDFAATGSVLTWAATQKMAGRRVQFCDLHRLVAIFFNVIGVGEYATVLSRRN